MRWASILLVSLIFGCARPPAPAIEDAGGGQNVSGLVLRSIAGTRDGDRLAVRVVYGDSIRELRLDLHFSVGVPTRLESGTWSGLSGQGTVVERSSKFLGGQSGVPSLGGRFDLMGPDGVRYRVNLPLQQLKDPL